MESFIGALIGAWAGLVVAAFTPRFKYQFIMGEKIAERRIQAHENVIAVALRVRVIVLDGDENQARYPEILSSEEAFHGWFLWYQSKILSCTTWLCIEARRELNFFQDYMTNLMQVLRGQPEEVYRQVGAIIRKDFLELHASLEAAAAEYFNNSLTKLERCDLKSDPKYSDEETKKRLEEMLLSTKREEINKLLVKIDESNDPE